MASSDRESKKVQNMELFEKARTCGHFSSQRHVELDQGFRVLRVVDCLPTPSLFERGSMAPLSVQFFRKDFPLITTYFSTTLKNLAQLQID